MITEIAGLPIRSIKDESINFNFLVYGNSGAGKTTLAGSADQVPEMRRVLFLDIEGGTLSLRNLYSEVEKVRLTDWKQFEKLYEELKNGKHDFRTIVIDSLTETQKLGMDYTMKTRRGDDDLAIPEIKEWGINIEQTRKFVRMFRDLPFNIIMTALCRVDIDKRSGMSTKKPMLSGKAADEVTAFFDIVTYLYTEEVDGQNQRILLTDSVPGTIAKDRSNALPKQMLAPTMSEIYKYVIEGKTSTDDVQA